MKRRHTGQSPEPCQLGFADLAAPVNRNTVHFSSLSDEWPTPQWLFDALDAEFRFTLDPCATHANAKCHRHYTKIEDGLRQNWGEETVFMNPPYGRLVGRFMAKAYESATAGATVVCLVPARTDTRWWHTYAMKGEIRLLQGRLKFDGARNSAPFPSAIVVFRPRAYALKSVQTVRASARRKGHRRDIALGSPPPPEPQTPSIIA